MVTSRGWHLCLFLGKVDRQDTCALTDGVQVATDQGWSKYLPIYQSFDAFSWKYQANFGGSIIAAKRRGDGFPAAQTDLPRGRVTLKFKDEDAEAVMAKALEGGSDSEKEAPLFPEAMEISAPLETSLKE